MVQCMMPVDNDESVVCWQSQWHGLASRGLDAVNLRVAVFHDSVALRYAQRQLAAACRGIGMQLSGTASEWHWQWQ